MKLAIRITIFLATLYLYLFEREWLESCISQSVFDGINIIHVVWFVFMVMMIQHLFSPKILTMALRKADEKEYMEVPGYSRMELLEYVQHQNVRAWIVMLAWLSANAVFGVLYLFKIMGDVDLVMLTVFYFLCDYICILFFCPFQTCIMGNRCCVNCRIFDWGHFMMFTPMLFIKSFFSWILFFTSAVVLIRWEIIYAMHSERFWSGSNQHLQCANCNDKICQVKKSIANSMKKRKK